MGEGAPTKLDFFIVFLERGSDILGSNKEHLSLLQAGPSLVQRKTADMVDECRNREVTTNLSMRL
jgi:hypothetical protein